MVISSKNYLPSATKSSKTVPVCSGDRQLVYREPWSLVTKYANTDHGSDKSPRMDGGSSVGRFIHFDWWSCFIRVAGPATLIHLFTPSRSNIRDQGDWDWGCSTLLLLQHVQSFLHFVDWESIRIRITVKCNPMLLNFLYFLSQLPFEFTSTALPCHNINVRRCPWWRYTTKLIIYQ